MYAKLMTLFVFLMPLGLLSTTILPLSLESQLEEADGVILGKFLGSNSKKLPNGDIVTEASFVIEQSSGISYKDIVNPNDFKVIYPGGKWQGLVHHVPSAPTFYPNEKSILILKKSGHGFIVNNLSLGKYRLEVEDGIHYVVSTLYPNDQRIGKIRFSSFNDHVMKIYGQKLSLISHDKYVYKENLREKARQDKLKNRLPASSHEEEVVEESSRLGMLWLVFILAVLAAYMKRRGKRFK